MYPFPNQPVYNGYQEIQQCSFFGSTVTEPAAVDVQRDRLGPVPDTSGTQIPPSASKPTKSKEEVVNEDGKVKKPATEKGAVDSSSFSVEERIVTAVWVHERRHNHVSMGQIKQQFEQRFGRAAPAKNTLLAWERKLFARGSVHDAPRSGRPARRKLVAAEVLASLRAAPGLSLRARACALHVPRSTLRALLLRDLPPGAQAKKKTKSTTKQARAPPAPLPHPATELT